MEGQSLVLCRDPGGQTKVLDVGGRGGGGWNKVCTDMKGGVAFLKDRLKI